MTRGREIAGIAAWFALFAALAAALALLGRWQLGRAADYRAQTDAYSAGRAREALGAVGDVPADWRSARFRRLELAGRYDADTQILLDNVTHAGEAGYYVLTPFRVAGSGRPVLVNRGWIGTGPDRGRVPAIGLGTAPGRVAGRIDSLPRAALSLGAGVELLAPGVYRMSYPTLGEIETVIGAELAPFQLLLDAGEPAGYTREWGPDTRRADRSTAYAGQWFIMAVAAAGLALWQLRRGRNLSSRDTDGR